MMILHLTLSLFLSFIHLSSSPPCNSKEYSTEAIKALPKNYTFLKVYPVDGKGGKRKTVNYNYIFSKNISYLLKLKSGDANIKGMYVVLKNKQGKTVASSYTKGKYFNGLLYRCKATGVYSISFIFEGKSDYCAGAVLAFKR